MTTVPRATQAPLPAHNPFQAEWVYETRFSPWPLLIAGLPHGVAFAVLPTLTLPLMWQIVLGGAVALSLAYYGLLYLGYWPQRVLKRVVWREFGGWEVWTKNGEHYAARLLTNSFVSRYVIVLNFKTLQGNTFSLFITADTLPLSQARHLRRRLNFWQPQ